MSTRTVTLSMINDYPFSISSDYQQPKTTVQVKKTIEFHIQSRLTMKDKIRVLKVLGQRHLVAVIAHHEEQRCISLIYEYVHKKMDYEVRLLDAEGIQNVRIQMLQLASIMTEHAIVHQLSFDNVGLGQKNQLKYFLGVNFRVDKQVNKRSLGDSYRQAVQGMFGEGGRFKRRELHSKRQYSETMDTTVKVNASNQALMCSYKPAARPTLKKSISIADAPVQVQIQEQNQNGLMQCVALTPGYQQETTSQTKSLKMQNLGMRINKLKDYVKGLTGRTPKGKVGLAHFTVRLNGNNMNDRILQQTKLFISPNYTKLEKKIAEWRQSKLYRTFEQKEILYEKDNQAYQIQTTQKSAINSNPRSASKQNPAKTTMRRVVNAHRPHKLAIPASPSNKMTLFRQDKSRIQIEERSRSKHSLQVSKLTSNHEGSYENDYRKIVNGDKYCEEFMYFLDDEAEPQQNGDKSPLTSLIAQIGKEAFQPRQQEARKDNIAGTKAGIDTRVKKAIQNSLKLITGLKQKESQP